METIHKAYKFRITPNDAQKQLLAKHFGACRFVYNRFLHERKEKYLTEKTSLNYYDNAKMLTDLKQDVNFSWLKEVNSQSLQASIRDLDTAYRNFFNKQNRFPRFKSKHDRQSFRIPQSVQLSDNKLIIPKFKEGIAVTKHREIGGDILFATISKTATGKYYVSLVCETSHEAFPKTDSAVGIDTGIKDFAVLSSGTTYKNIKVLKSKLKKLKYQQKRLSKKRKGSHSRRKQRKIVAALHEKTANIRNDYLHKVSTEIIKNHDVICTETLTVKNMMKNHKLAQAFADVGLGTFYAMLEYKAKWNNRSFIQIDRFFPSSKTCNVCHHIHQGLTLKDREWTCEKCNAAHDRDFNASLNILKQGLNRLGCGSGTGSQDKQKRAEALPLGKSMKLEAAPFRAR